MHWSNWGEIFANKACLCLKPEQELVQKLVDVVCMSEGWIVNIKRSELIGRYGGHDPKKHDVFMWMNSHFQCQSDVAW